MFTSKKLQNAQIENARLKQSIIETLNAITKNNHVILDNYLYVDMQYDVDTARYIQIASIYDGETIAKYIANNLDDAYIYELIGE